MSYAFESLEVSNSTAFTIVNGHIQTAAEWQYTRTKQVMPNWRNETKPRPEHRTYASNALKLFSSGMSRVTDSILIQTGDRKEYPCGSGLQVCHTDAQLQISWTAVWRLVRCMKGKQRKFFMSTKYRRRPCMRNNPDKHCFTIWLRTTFYMDFSSPTLQWLYQLNMRRNSCQWMMACSIIETRFMMNYYLWSLSNGMQQLLRWCHHPEQNNWKMHIQWMMQHW